MYNVTIKDVFLSTVLETRVANKDGTHPIKIRISHKGVRLYYVIAKRFTLSIKDWDNLPKAKSNKATSIKDTINDEFNYFQSLVKSITNAGEYSHEKLKKYKDKQPTKSLSEKFNVIINELRANGQINSAGLYVSTLKSIEGYAQKKLVFEDITPKWLEDYERVVTDEERSHKKFKINKEDKPKKVHISFTTLGIYLRNLRAVFNRAIVDGDINESIYPFSRSNRDGKYRIPVGEGTKIALTIQQLASVEAYQPKREGIEISRDLFLLSFHLAGLNFKDMLLLKWSDLHNDEISLVREKTKRTNQTKGKKITISVNSKAKELITRLSSTSNGDYILPYITPNPTPSDVVRITKNLTKITNKHLDMIGKELGIEGITTYVARHTFATVLKNSGVPLAFISESLGHSSLSTTQSYMKSFEKKQRDETFDILSNITNTNNAQNN